MDEADHAYYQEQLTMDDLLKLRKKTISPTGFCANCEDPAQGVFCCLECSEDWQKRQDMNERNGI